MKNNLLFSFVAIIFLLLGGMNYATAQCDITIDMADSYGDGWNGASVEVYNDTDLLNDFIRFNNITNITFPIYHQ